MQVNGWNLIFSVPVYNSLEDHHHEIMSFCWENGYHGVLSDEGEFALYNPPKYFSAHDLKLSYQVIQVIFCQSDWFFFRQLTQNVTTNFVGFTWIVLVYLLVLNSGPEPPKISTLFYN